MNMIITSTSKLFPFSSIKGLKGSLYIKQKDKQKREVSSQVKTKISVNNESANVISFWETFNKEKELEGAHVF